MRARTLSSFSNCQRGNVAMMFGLALFIILGAAGLALDYQRAATIYSNMQEAADAALIAAVKYKQTNPNVSDDAVKSRAIALFESNMRTTWDYSYSNFDISFDPSTEQYAMSFDTNIRTSILQALNFAEIEPRVVTKAKLGKSPYLEVVMVLDNTGSMNSDGKLSDLKKAAKNLVATLFSNPDADVKIGLVPFAQYVSVGEDKEGASWLDGASTGVSFNGCVGSRGYPANTKDSDYSVNPIPEVPGAPCPRALHALTDDRTIIDNAIQAMKASGWTYIPAGLAWGWRVISPEAPFTEGATDTELKDKNGFKTIILMTDGKNTKSPDYPTHDNSNVTYANKITAELCDAIKDENIVIYTIAFAVSDLTIKALLEDCGTTPHHYFEPDTADELNDAFEAIANTLRSITLTE